MSNASHRFDNDLRYRAEDHINQTQLTPSYVLEPVRAALGGEIYLDPCSTSASENPCGAVNTFSPPVDGAKQDWTYASIFCNPPYGKARERWVAKCIEAGTRGIPTVLLIPAHPDTRAFQRAAESASFVVFIKGRVKFGVLRPNRRQMAASHPSALICWNVASEPLRHLGWIAQSVGICGSYNPSNLRSPYADSAGSLDASRHAVARNRSGNRSLRFGAPDSRYERMNQATQTRDSTRATYEGLTRGRSGQAAT